MEYKKVSHQIPVRNSTTKLDHIKSVRISIQLRAASEVRENILIL